LLGAFRAYRNYDGQGSEFGDTSVRAHSSDIELGSVYASLDSSDASRMVIVAINRSAETLETAVVIEHTTTYDSLSAYVIHATQPVPVPAGEVESVGNNQFGYLMQPYSVTVLVPSE
jgi:hypothetical protein